MAIASMVLGIVAIVICWFPIIGFVVSMVGLIIAIVAYASKKTKGEQTGLKITGLVLSIIATVISLFFSVIPMIILLVNSSRII